ncbi:MAG: HAD-IIA family hydrolase [Deltaproteobacteria bacterium]|nr:HAD-IIA family hydrolase [Deltaproteobacteria bacterium]
MSETHIPTELADIRGVLLDLDGTLYVSGALLPRTPDLFAALRQREIPFLCLTNNSSRRSSDYVTKLRTLGVEVAPHQVLTSGEATIHHVLTSTPHRSAFVVGTEAFRAEVAESGIDLDEEKPDCLIVAYDTDLDYAKLSVATRLLFADTPYFATHPDLTCISDAGLLPDIAATIEGLAAVTGRRPRILGKPELPMVAAAAARLGLPIKALAMVGDQLDTDMTMAARHGLLGILVLSGETSRGSLEASSIQPDLVISDVGVLAERILNI